MIVKQTLKSIVIKNNKFSKMVDNLGQTKTSIKNNIKMLTLAERESKRLLARDKYSELGKCKTNTRDKHGNFTRLEI